MISKLPWHLPRAFRAALWLSVPAAIALWFGLQAVAGSRAQSPSENIPADKFYKNIQVFKGLPSSQLIENMFYMEGALGVSCTECHVNFTDFEKDDNPHKQVARSMIQMVRELNKDSFGGQSKVSCNTCHRGRNTPVAPLAFAAIKNSKASSAAAPAEPAPALTVDEILDRYVSATGAKSAGEKLAGVELKGSMLSSEGWTAPLQIYIGAPDKLLATFDIGWMSYNAFNGTKAWSQDNHGLHDMAGKNLVLFKRKAAIFHASLLKDQYSKLTPRGEEIIDDHEACVVEGVMEGADNERLYFDVRSGLLVRIQSGTETSLGALPHQIDLKDYREVGGVQLPFEFDDSAPDFSTVYKIAEAVNGPPIRAQLFDKPLEPLKGFPN